MSNKRLLRKASLTASMWSWVDFYDSNKGSSFSVRYFIKADSTCSKSQALHVFIHPWIKKKVEMSSAEDFSEDNLSLHPKNFQKLFVTHLMQCFTYPFVWATEPEKKPQSTSKTTPSHIIRNLLQAFCLHKLMKIRSTELCHLYPTCKSKAIKTIGQLGILPRNLT